MRSRPSSTLPTAATGLAPPEPRRGRPRNGSSRPDLARRVWKPTKEVGGSREGRYGFREPQGTHTLPPHHPVPVRFGRRLASGHLPKGAGGIHLEPRRKSLREKTGCTTVIEAVFCSHTGWAVTTVTGKGRPPPSPPVGRKPTRLTGSRPGPGEPVHPWSSRSTRSGSCHLLVGALRS